MTDATPHWILARDEKLNKPDRAEWNWNPIHWHWENFDSPGGTYHWKWRGPWMRVWFRDWKEVDNG